MRWFIILFVVVMGILPVSHIQASKLTESNKVERISSDYLYLSDLDYITTNKWSYTGYGSIKKDTNPNGGVITLYVDGETVSFDKGMGVHATGQLTYDISRYSNTYTRFLAKLGIDKSQKGSVWFRISVSKDGNTWESIYQSEPVTGQNNAYSVDLNIKGYKYLRLYVDSNGGNGNDHSVFADARIVKSDYDIASEWYPEIKELSYYDQLLSKNTPDYNYEHNLDLILKREFVSRVGFWTLQNEVKNADTKETIDWLFQDPDALQLLIETGNINNNKIFLTTLTNLYQNYKQILGSTGDAYVYKKMLLALSVTYSTDRTASPLRFSTYTGANMGYDVITRYALLKELYDSNLFPRKEEYQTYPMELMRIVVNISASNEDIIWLRKYSEIRVNNLGKRLDPYMYMAYISPNYNRDPFFDLANKDLYDTKYHLSEFGVTFGIDRTQKTWMVMEAGGICWNISRMGQDLNKVHGIPAIGTYQPQHEAYFVYSEDNAGNGLWNIGNNVFGWGQSYSTWDGGNPYRLLLNWNNKSFALGSSYNSTYILLGQAALNQYEEYQKSFYYGLLANSITDEKQKIDLYQKSLEVLNINLDSYDSLITLYKREQVTSKVWKDLAPQVIDAYTYYPGVMVDVLGLITPYLDQTDTVTIDTAKTIALKKATQTDSTVSLQPNPCKTIANTLLGDNKVELADFSFDGSDAGKIVINEKYEDYDFQVQYSIDGGNTWKVTKEHKISLTKAELTSITSELDIQVKISGLNEIYMIDILEGEAISTSTLAQNDEENRLLGKVTSLEYRYDDQETWNDYTSTTRFEGEQKVHVRYKAHGRYLIGGEQTYVFHADDTDTTKQYIPVDHIELVSTGTAAQNGQEAVNMIDANPLTSWHTIYNKVATDKSYVVTFDQVKYLSKISYDPAGVNGRIKSVEIYTSLDGINWTLSGQTSTNWANNENRKELVLDTSVATKYVKIVALATYGNTTGEINKYVSGKRFNFYEDQTKTYQETATINYSINSLTNQNVVATLELPEGATAFETTHIFTENGTYTFSYEDLNGNKQTIEAVVTWIDKELPTATVTYDVSTWTNFVVKATLENFSKENVKILNGDADGSYIFSENGTYVFEIQDEAGNIGQVTAKVTWIDLVPPTAEIKYERTEKGTILATIINVSEPVTYQDNINSYEFLENGTYEFVLTDRAGNSTLLLATVTTIEKEPDDSKDDPIDQPTDDEKDPEKPSDEENGSTEKEPDDNKESSNQTNSEGPKKETQTNSSNQENNSSSTEKEEPNDSKQEDHKEQVEDTSKPSDKTDQHRTKKKNLVDDFIDRLLYKTDYDGIDYMIIGCTLIGIFVLSITISKRRHRIIIKKKEESTEQKDRISKDQKSDNN